VGITAVVLLTALLASAPVEVPGVDDWTYAWSVEHFLHTGELRVLEWSAHYPLAQILWGGSLAAKCPVPSLHRLHGRMRRAVRGCGR
jgi:hypothetical protein